MVKKKKNFKSKSERQASGVDKTFSKSYDVDKDQRKSKSKNKRGRK